MENPKLLPKRTDFICNPVRRDSSFRVLSKAVKTVTKDIWKEINIFIVDTG